MEITLFDLVIFGIIMLGIAVVSASIKGSTPSSIPRSDERARTNI